VIASRPAKGESIRQIASAVGVSVGSVHVARASDEQDVG
jgi:AcrR family transcriptional regulator